MYDPGMEATETIRPSDTTEKLVELRAILDEAEGLNARLSQISARRMEIEADLRKYHEATGTEKISAGGMSISFNPEALRAKYDPDKWSGIVRWAAETGNDFIIQRRLTDAKVVSLIESGVPLPDGLDVETYLKINIRRV